MRGCIHLGTVVIHHHMSGSMWSVIRCLSISVSPKLCAPVSQLRHDIVDISLIFLYFSVRLILDGTTSVTFTSES